VGGEYAGSRWLQGTEKTLGYAWFPWVIFSEDRTFQALVSDRRLQPKSCHWGTRFQEVSGQSEEGRRKFSFMMHEQEDVANGNKRFMPSPFSTDWEQI